MDVGTIIVGIAVVAWAVGSVISDRVRHSRRARRADAGQSTPGDVEEGLSEFDVTQIRAQQVSRWHDANCLRRLGSYPVSFQLHAGNRPHAYISVLIGDPGGWNL